MRKKFIILLLISIFLISAVSFISAYDSDDYYGGDEAVDSVEDPAVDTQTTDSSNDNSNDNSQNVNTKVKLTVKVDWRDHNSPNRPTSVTVYVMKDGQKVESVVLSSENGWTKTVEVNRFDGSGNEISYSVSEDTISGYKDPVVSKKDNQFTLTNELKQVSLSSPQNTVNEKVSDVNNVSNDDKNSSDEDKTVNNTNITVHNKTIYNTTVHNKTINNTTINNKVINNTVVNNKNVNKTPTKEAPKKDDKNKQKKPLLHTGNPILILVIVIIVVAVAYYFYSKR